MLPANGSRVEHNITIGMSAQHGARPFERYLLGGRGSVV
jgi:hypothetical protein